MSDDNGLDKKTKDKIKNPKTATLPAGKVAWETWRQEKVIRRKKPQTKQQLFYRQCIHYECTVARPKLAEMPLKEQERIRLQSRRGHERDARRMLEDPTYREQQLARRRVREREKYAKQRDPNIAIRREHRKQHPITQRERGRRCYESSITFAAARLRDGTIGFDDFNRRVSEAHARFNERAERARAGRNNGRMQLRKTDRETNET